MSIVTDMKKDCKSIKVHTLGCRVNRYESDALLALLEEAEGVTGEVIVINTCAVTSEAEKKSRQSVSRARRDHPEAFIAAIGCSTQLHPEAYGKYASFIAGTRNKREVLDSAVAHFANEEYEKISVKDPSSLPYERFEAQQTERTRAYVKIQDGCNRKCAYCIIRKARGRAVSDSEDSVIERLKKVRAEGYREVVLSGIETSYYGTDTGTGLASLIEKTAALGFDRIRLGSMDPTYFTDENIERLSKIKALMPHFHLSLQSGSSRVLQTMRRPYTAETVIDRVNAIRRAIPDVRFSADIIAGFPGETEEELFESGRMISFLKPVHAHIFPFSPREGTEAYEMKCAPSHERARAARYLIGLAEETERKYSENYIGKTLPVLFETDEGGYSVGHSPEFMTVRMKTEKELSGSIEECTVIGYADGVYEAEPKK